ncbi:MULTISPECIES: DUF3261 domain-containing protein [Cupriavidus]|uniref:DUF3261 domain-containing protein n=1 Tax=Cupriavidus TaxID=106589 RepID=UPI0003BFCA26|nr:MULTISPECIES: DUF3261 domain-containing protein [Cupriavidus]ESH95033.1 hypothetical protein B551_0219585 [Cupriavidus sp. HPC(L)]MCD9120399.1 DUF3261 domain-containing protein [Cupriavidus sp. UGS-1]
MPRLIQTVVAAGLVAWLAACAGLPPSPSPSAAAAAPVLRLQPAALQRTIAVQQHIEARYRTAGGRVETRELIALLQADAKHTRLAALAGGQVLARLDWDGTRLDVSRASWAPAQLDPERILSDLQLSLWPLRAVADALPTGWTVREGEGRRVLHHGDEVVAEVQHADAGTLRFIQHRDGYALTIRTLAGGETSQ